MALKDFVLPTKEVALPDGSSFAVRGISLEDITTLIADHGPVMEDFFRKYSGDTSQSPLEVGMNLIGQAPLLVANLIALAADEPKMTAVIRRFPLNVQQEALEKIADLTFDASGGPGKFMEAVIRLVKGTTNLMGGLTPSPNGSLESGGK